jgi:hypothetical protein
VHPLRENPGRAAGLVAVLVCVLALVRLNYPEPWWTLFSGVVLFGATARFFLPTSYRLDENGVRSRFLGISLGRPWKDFKRYEVYHNGVLLSPFDRPSRLDSFRGMFLLFGPKGEDVIEFIRGRFEPERPAVG